MTHVKQFLVMLTMVLSISVLQGNALALGLEYYGVEMTINDDRSVNNMVVMDFDAPVNRLDYNLDFKIQNLEYEYDFDFADCSVTDSGTGSVISCTFIGMTQEDNKLTLDFDTMDAVKRDGDDYRFTVNYGTPLSIDSSFILIRLPQNNILAGEEGQSFFPDTGGTLQFSILFTRPVVDENLLDLLVTLVVVIAVIAALFALFYFRRRGTKVAVVKSVLNKDEKKIIDILNANKGKAGQKLLVRETDFSKAKVSRIVKSMKERGVVDTEPISGRENRVLLKLGKKEDE